MKHSRPEFREVNAAVLQNVVRRVGFIYDAFFRRLRTGAYTKPPRFRSSRRYDSFTHPNVYWSLSARRARFPGIGDIKWEPWKDLTEIGKPKTFTIRREVDGYYAVLSCEVPSRAPLAPTGKTIGLDVGLTKLITTNTGEVIGDLTRLKRLEGAMRHTQRIKDRRVFGSRRREKAIDRLGRAHQKLARVRKAQLDLISHTLISQYDVICIEDLDVAKLAQSRTNRAGSRGLRRNIHHASWAALRHMLTYKAEEAGRRIVAVSPRGTTQECSACGTVVRKTLSERIHRCECGLVIDRDTNAARNILERGLQLLRREATEPRRPDKIAVDHG